MRSVYIITADVQHVNDVHDIMCTPNASCREKRRLEALLRRAGGHPYDADEMIGFGVVDPTKSPGENVWNMLQVRVTLCVHDV